GHQHLADVRLDRAERIVRRLRRRGRGQRVEHRRLADIGQAEDAACETHEVSLVDWRYWRRSVVRSRVLGAEETFRLHGEVDLVLEGGVLALGQKLGVVGNDAAQGLDPWPLALGEV